MIGEESCGKQKGVRKEMGTPCEGRRKEWRYPEVSLAKNSNQANML